MQRRQSFSVLAVASILIIGAVGGVLGGCTRASDGSDSVVSATTQETRSESETATTIPAETTSTTAELTEEEAIIAAVNGYWQAFSIAGDPPDPDHPVISQFTTGEARDRLVQRLAEVRMLNQAIREPSPTVFESNPSIISIRGHTALVIDCVVDDSQLIDVASGQVLDAEVGTILFSLTLEFEGDSWKVARKTIEQRWEGQTQCDLSA